MATTGKAKNRGDKLKDTYALLKRNNARLEAIINKDEERIAESIGKLLRNPEKFGKEGPMLAQLVKDGWEISRLCSKITGKAYRPNEFEDYYNELLTDPPSTTP